MVNRLAIDTSSPIASVALDCGGENIFWRELPSRDSHSQSLQQMVEELIKDSPLGGVSELDQILIGLGPGSFTGLRIGMSFVKGLSWAHQIPVAGVASFEAMARAQQEKAETIAVLSDARRGEYFFAAWQVRENELVTLESLRIVNERECRDFLERYRGDGQFMLIDAGNEKLPMVDLAVKPAVEITCGMLNSCSVIQPWTLEQLTLLEPIYIREVAALTIQDRRNRGML